MSGNTKKKPNKFLSRIVYICSGDAAHWIVHHFGFIVYVFVLLCFVIIWSLVAENDLVAIQKNDKRIEDLQISYHQLELDYVGMNNRSRVDKLLEKNHSTLHSPKNPPTVIVIE